MKIILISGKSGHGKDYLSCKLKKELESQDKKVVIDHFARYIKEILKIYGNWDGEKNDTWRYLLQYLGTEIIRQKMYKPMFHVQRICEDIDAASKVLNIDYVIVSDARFQNEVEYCKAYFPNDVVTIKVERFNEDLSKYDNFLTAEQRIHDSECGLDNYIFDYKFNNIENDDESQSRINYLIKEII